MPVTYKGREQIFKVTLQVFGYSYRLVVDVNGQAINFERDEERIFRAVLNYDDVENSDSVDRGLIEAIGESIREVLK